MTQKLTKASRKKTRKFLFQKIFARSFSDIDENLFQKSFFDDIFTFELDKPYMDEMYKLIIEKESELIAVIEKYAPKFDIKSMNITAVIAIFIGLTEMLYLKEEIPMKVSINEAVEMAKVYSSDSSKKIVNGILNNFYKDIENHKKLDAPKPNSDFSFFSNT